MINPILMHIEDVERICDKSKRIWGSKWRWRKEADRRGFTWEEIEERLDNIFKRHEAIIEKARNNVKRKSNKQLGNDGRTDGGDGGGIPAERPEGEVSPTTDSSDNAPVRVSGPIDGKEVRSGETEDGTTTPGGTE